jgi:hypothetical protein
MPEVQAGRLDNWLFRLARGEMVRFEGSLQLHDHFLRIMYYVLSDLCLRRPQLTAEITALLCRFG